METSFAEIHSKSRQSSAHKFEIATRTFSFLVLAGKETFSVFLRIKFYELFSALSEFMLLAIMYYWENLLLAESTTEASSTSSATFFFFFIRLRLFFMCRNNNFLMNKLRLRKKRSRSAENMSL